MVVLLLAPMVALLAAATMAMVVAIEDPVAPPRVTRFALRYGLSLDADSTSAVLRYLGTTRRWRLVGLVVGLAYGVGAGISDHSLSVDLATGFLGWFGGALVAEWRVALASPGARRTATLSPRRLQQYVGRVALAVPVAALVVTAGVGVVALVTGQTSARRVAAAGFLGVAVVVAAAAVVALRHVVRRAQPGSLDPAVIAADDAIRGRSLHVLCGSATCFLLGIAGALVTLSSLGHPAATVLSLSTLVGGLLVGWLVATEVRPWSRPEPCVARSGLEVVAS